MVGTHSAVFASHRHDLSAGGMGILLCQEFPKGRERLLGKLIIGEGSNVGRNLFMLTQGGAAASADLGGSSKYLLLPPKSALVADPTWIYAFRFLLSMFILHIYVSVQTYTGQLNGWSPDKIRVFITELALFTGGFMFAS